MAKTEIRIENMKPPRASYYRAEIFVDGTSIDERLGCVSFREALEWSNARLYEKIGGLELRVANVVEIEANDDPDRDAWKIGDCWTRRIYLSTGVGEESFELRRAYDGDAPYVEVIAGSGVLRIEPRSAVSARLFIGAP